MPKIYRAMRADETKRPAIGTSSATLGARIPGDIDADANDLVHPGTGGMSVSPSLRTLPIFLIPRRLRHLVPGAAGNSSSYVWSLGNGDFVAAPVTQQLSMRPDPDKQNHGFVEPAQIMPKNEYHAALAATQPDWTVDEN